MQKKERIIYIKLSSICEDVIKFHGLVARFVYAPRLVAVLNPTALAVARDRVNY